MFPHAGTVAVVGCCRRPVGRRSVAAGTVVSAVAGIEAAAPVADAVVAAIDPAVSIVFGDAVVAVDDAVAAVAVDGADAAMIALSADAVAAADQTRNSQTIVLASVEIALVSDSSCPENGPHDRPMSAVQTVDPDWALAAFAAFRRRPQMQCGQRSVHQTGRGMR